MVTRPRIEERLYRQYMEFFEKAERDRRWNLFTDVAWDRVNPAVPDDVALCAETFCGVELYLPDYVAQGINIVREWFGRAWFQANWGYEESKHALALGEWLVRSGKRTKDQLHDFHQTILSRTWTRPFGTGRLMTCYGIVQEMATFLIYCRHREYAKAQGDDCLHQIYSLIARDEVAHAHFYTDVIRVLLEEDRPGTIADLDTVFANFAMPGVDLVPDYDARILRMRAVGIDRNLFVRKVYNPVLRDLGVTKDELKQARRARVAREAAQRAKDGPPPKAPSPGVSVPAPAKTPAPAPAKAPAAAPAAHAKSRARR